MADLIAEYRYGGCTKRPWLHKAASLMVVIMFCIVLAPYADKFVNRVTLQVSAYIIAIMCMMVIAFKSKSVSYHNVKWFWSLLFIYLLFLFVRLFVDFVLPDKGFFMYNNSETVMFFYFCPILIPAVFFFKHKIEFNVRKCFWVCAIIFAICMVASYRAFLSGDIEMSNDGRYGSGFGIFSISFGQYACSLILISIYLLRGSSIMQKIILVSFILLGGICIALSGSRGPFVTLFLCLIMYFVANNPKLIWAFVIIGILVMFGDFLKELFMELDSYLRSIGITSFSRIVNTVFADDGLAKHSSGRDILYDEGVALFLKHPFFGNSFLIPGKIYVHNIILEQFMATGIFGGLIFIIINIIAFRQGIKLIRFNRNLSIFPLLMLQYFVFGCLSLTIIALAPYWLFMFLTISNANTIK